MSAHVDEYIETNIKPKAVGSAFLRNFTAPTLKNSPLVGVVCKTPVLRFPKNYVCAVHSGSGNPRETDLAPYAASAVDLLVKQADAIGAVPVAVGNVIDSNSGDLRVLETIARALVERADYHHLAILNGENAIHGDRITNANVAVTMVSMLPRDSKFAKSPTFRYGNVAFAQFDPDGNLVHVNCDGVGTKTAIYVGAKRFWPAIDDAAAMNLDDGIKKGSEARALSLVVETRGKIPIEELEHRARRLGHDLDCAIILQQESVGSRIRGLHENSPAYNVSGSLVSVIDEEFLRSPPTPKPGDYVIALRGRPGPRSNGITDKRKFMARMFGEDWYTRSECQPFLDFLSTPSTVFYPLFAELLFSKVASGVFHMSGGAYRDKLAKPLAELGLFARLDGLFPPDWREAAIAGFGLTPPEVCYAKWPMGNEGFLTVPDPDRAIRIIGKYNLECKVVGKLSAAENGMAGVEILTPSGHKIYFSGND